MLKANNKQNKYWNDHFTHHVVASHVVQNPFDKFVQDLDVFGKHAVIAPPGGGVSVSKQQQQQPDQASQQTDRQNKLWLDFFSFPGGGRNGVKKSNRQTH